MIRRDTKQKLHEQRKGEVIERRKRPTRKHSGWHEKKRNGQEKRSCWLVNAVCSVLR